MLCKWNASHRNHYREIPPTSHTINKQKKLFSNKIKKKQKIQSRILYLPSKPTEISNKQWHICNIKRNQHNIAALHCFMLFWLLSRGLYYFLGSLLIFSEKCILLCIHDTYTEYKHNFKMKILLFMCGFLFQSASPYSVLRIYL